MIKTVGVYSIELRKLLVVEEISVLQVQSKTVTRI
jgi:hypothetical protein